MTTTLQKSVWLLLASFVACGLFCPGSFAAELTLKAVEKEPPKELDASIRAALQSKAIQLLDGEKPALEFWLRSEIPLEAKPASIDKGLDGLKQAALLGVVSVAKATRDYRDDTVPSGHYTMRFASQPQDGNHLGTAEFLYFAVLTPAKLDTRLDGITDYKTLVKASSKETSTDHPMVISLRPATSEEGDFPKLNEPAPEHKSIRLKIPAKASGSDQKTSLAFELVYQGVAKK